VINISLKCQLCGKEIYYDRKVCRNCEDDAIKSGLNELSEGIHKKWRCDNFLELTSLVFGSRLETVTGGGPSEKLPRLGKLENFDYDWNNLSSFSNPKMLINEQKINNFLIFE